MIEIHTFSTLGKFPAHLLGIFIVSIQRTTVVIKYLLNRTAYDRDSSQLGGPPPVFQQLLSLFFRHPQQHGKWTDFLELLLTQNWPELIKDKRIRRRRFLDTASFFLGVDKYTPESDWLLTVVEQEMKMFPLFPPSRDSSSCCSAWLYWTWCIFFPPYRCLVSNWASSSSSVFLFSSSSSEQSSHFSSWLTDSAAKIHTEQRNGRMDGWMDGWRERGKDGSICEQFKVFLFIFVQNYNIAFCGVPSQGSFSPQMESRKVSSP